jgi:asparagine synthase (glutamine-hydrolysing)
MCGIAGIFNSNASVDHRHIRTMCDILRHRGPDDEGFLAVNTQEHTVLPLSGLQSRVPGEHIDTFNGKANLFLGHRRLSILDLSSAGHQPMADKDGNVWIVFNGEIYNYVELKLDLIKKGYSFRTTTDTEVLLYSYLEWGIDCLDKFNGMWAFVIYDKRNNSLWGARDRFGVKPLYYYYKNGYFIFASEIKALVGLPLVEKRINETAAYDYLSLSINDPRDCFFKGIKELKPSEAFSVDLTQNSLREWIYYRLQITTDWEPFEKQRLLSIEEKVRELFINAVRLRLRSDAAVGSCLSGGMDSSAIVCIINDFLKKETLQSIGIRQKVFTACYTDDTIDEGKWAKVVVDATKTEWHRSFPDSQTFLEDMDDLIYSQEVPFGSTSLYAQYRVMKMARENGVKVLLDGQGGDELFAGYPIYYVHFFMDLLKNGEFHLLAHELKQRRNTPIKRFFIRLLLHGFVKQPIIDLLPPGLKRYYHFIVNQPTRYLNKGFVERNKRNGGHAEKTSFVSLQSMLAIMMNRHLPELLRYEDRNSMRFSIESRTPFADDIDLISYVFSVPSVYKIHDGWTKYLLRKAASGVTPPAILQRTDKIGFNTPEFNWIFDLKDDILSAMQSDGLDEFIDYRKISRNWDPLLQNQRRSGITSIWRHINFALWKKRFSL